MNYVQNLQIKHKVDSSGEENRVYLRNMASLSSTNFKPRSRSPGKRSKAMSSFCFPATVAIKNSSVIGLPPLKPI
jgi:hypothetical protein